MSTSSLQAAIFLGDAKAETLTNELTDNSMDLRLVQKYSSNDIEAVRAKYNPEKEQIRNEIAELDKTEQADEYQDLMTELKELREEEEAEVEAIEDKLNEYETEVQAENETLEVQLEDINAQTEVFKEMLKSNVEEEFSYFN
ncbi:MAG: hypothetical protein IJB79_09060 [Candidatus Gastranaerophilales bacterium]|nr:hypothetical protein [Candidatus Gastranaerophilales bacterium]